MRATCLSQVVVPAHWATIEVLAVPASAKPLAERGPTFTSCQCNMPVLLTVGTLPHPSLSFSKFTTSTVHKGHHFCFTRKAVFQVMGQIQRSTAGCPLRVRPASQNQSHADTRCHQTMILHSRIHDAEFGS